MEFSDFLKIIHPKFLNLNHRLVSIVLKNKEYQDQSCLRIKKDLHCCSLYIDVKNTWAYLHTPSYSHSTSAL